MEDQNRRRALRFRSWHRGTREMDLLMGSFADTHIGDFTPDQLNQYEAILEQSDPDLYSWLTGADTVPTEHDSHVMSLFVKHQYADKKIIE